MQLNRVFVLANLFFASAAPSAAAIFAPLGDLPGGSFLSEARDVAGVGLDATVVGLSRSGVGREPFIWDAVEGIRPLFASTTDDFSSATSLSTDASLVVGFGGLTSFWRGFVWDETLGAEQFVGGVPFLISGDGSTIAGTYRDGTTGALNPFHYSAAAGLVGIGDLPGGDDAADPRGISADGSVIVGSGRSPFGFEAFLWTADGGMQGLGDLPGGSFRSWANDVSSDGTTIVGQGASGASSIEAFRWTADGGMQGLGDLSGGGRRSEALGVSGDGSVVGGVGQTEAFLEAFVWDETNGMRSLQDLLVSEGLDLTGWHLQIAIAIADDGETIVGAGLNPDGETEAFLAYLPEPDGPAPLAMCVLLLVAGVRRRSAEWAPR
ncbi:MAG: PEP-CTERM sorting domain-containing protein [Myxococcota bacterium]